MKQRQFQKWGGMIKNDTPLINEAQRVTGGATNVEKYRHDEEGEGEEKKGEEKKADE